MKNKEKEQKLDEEQDCNCEDCDQSECGQCECEQCECDKGEAVAEPEAEAEQGDKTLEYLNLARQLQADFDNYRKRTQEEVKNARIAGQASMIEVFLPCLDTFKDAKKMITDESVLQGVEMIENKIKDTLQSQGVEKIESIGQKYNPSFHNVIAVVRNEDVDNDIILDEYQAGYTFGGKVIRYSKVIVNKKED